MILEDRGLTRVSLLDVVGRKRGISPNGTLKYDWLLVNYNGNVRMVSAGFFGTTDMDFALPEKAIIIHMVIDEKSEKEYLRFPIFDRFYYENENDSVDDFQDIIPTGYPPAH